MNLVILIGLQASGKSTFRRSFLDGTHVVVSKDRLRNNKRPARRQAQLIEEALGEGRDVVVDNTNPTVDERAALIAQARTHGARVIGYYFPSSVADSVKRNAEREGRERVPDVGIYATAKKLQRPSSAEGFDELHSVTVKEDGGFSIVRFVQEKQ